MSLPFILFLRAARCIAVVGALLLIFAREPIHSALALILVMMSLAVLYLLLGAEFIAAVQIIVYAGAIMVLFVFVIMLLNAGVGRAHQLQQAREICRPAAGILPAAGIARIGWRTRAIGSDDCQRRRSASERGGFHARAFHAAFSAVSVPV